MRAFPQKNNQKVFYANIGREPYIVNQYVRPKGLSSFRLTKDQSENEKEFSKRKDIYNQEKELKSQYENLRNKNATLRGSMLRDPIIEAQKQRNRPSNEIRPREYTLK